MGPGSDIQPRVATLSDYGSFLLQTPNNCVSDGAVDDTKLMSAGRAI
jgi:hypothetical protein